MREARPRRILVVDDEPVVRLLACESLAAPGFEVEGVEDGERALRHVSERRPDLVLLDVEMPGLDGFDTCSALRRLDAGRDLPVLMATGHTDAASIDRAFEVGATDFIRKPLDWQLLRHRIRFMLRAHDAFVDLRRTHAELRDSEGRLANAQRLARIGSWEWCPGEEMMLWSDEAYRIFGVGMGPEASTLAAFLSVVHAEDRPDVEKAMRAAAQEAAPWSIDHRVVGDDGSERFVHQEAEPFTGSDGRVLRVAGTVQDITERRRTEEQIRRLAYYDSLTGLPNRRMLNENMGRLIDTAKRRGRKVALLFIDLDRFKRLNDTLGHSMGDRLLKAAAGRLVSSVRATDFVVRPGAQPKSWNADDGAQVTRLGGDEFTVALGGVRSPEEAAQVARRIGDALRRPFSLGGQSYVMTASIGIALAPEDGSDADTLLRNSDAAMYHAKSAGRDGFRFFSEAMNREALRSLRLEGELRRAIERQELVLHYQPQQDLRSGRIVGVEALVRWCSPEFGLVPPKEFVPLAEETGLILPLGEWVLREACRQHREWRDAGVPPLRMAINVASRQLARPDLLVELPALLREHGIAAGQVELEITESAVMEDEPGVMENLRVLRNLGLRLALDDFGTGYSSLSRLLQLPIDTVKIDRAFVQAVGEEGKPDAIIAAVVAMARRMDLVVAAEGVETEVQESFLRAEGCDVLQGFRLARPMEGRELPRWLERQRDGD